MISCHRFQTTPPLIYYLIISSLATACRAFLTASASSRTNLHCPSVLSAGISLDEISRREYLESTTRVAGVISAAPFIEPAHAATAVQTNSKSVPRSLCDPSVSTWTKIYDNSLRTVHILGTAHISSASAELAGRLVREVKPNVVFVELDVKRVKRAIPGLSPGDSESSSSSNSNNPSEDATKSKIAAFTATPSPSNESNSSPIINLGSKYVGDAVKNMYGKLESEGFKAGDEFTMSVREGLANGSTIVLGDRDVEVTLRRLTKALAKTDIRKLLSTDSEVEKSMEELLPENLKEQMMKKGRGGGGVAVEVGKMVDQSESSMGMDVQVNKAEFQSFVETMKEKDNVKKIMTALQKTAPEIYEAMVAERDLNMAKGLDELGDNLKSDVGDTVAVMGMAHVDGVERYLYSQGWEEKRYPCPVVR